MTHTVFKSNLVPQSVSHEDAAASFGRIVQAMCAEKKAHHDHHLIVHAQVDSPLRDEPKMAHHKKAENPTAAWMEDHQAWCRERDTRYMPYPHPHGPADVMASIKTVIDPQTGDINYEPDFEVINDDPTPEQVLAARKQELILAVHQAENEALEKVQLPVGKRRAAAIREGDVRAKHEAEIFEALKHAKDEDDAKAIRKKVESGFDPDDVAHVRDQEHRSELMQAIIRAAAVATSDIEDLTLENVGEFVMPNFEV